MNIIHDVIWYLAFNLAVYCLFVSVCLIYLAVCVRKYADDERGLTWADDQTGKKTAHGRRVI